MSDWRGLRGSAEPSSADRKPHAVRQGRLDELQRSPELRAPVPLPGNQRRVDFGPAQFLNALQQA